jgi:hypothetical protein
MAKKEKYGHRDTFPRYFKADFELQQKVGTGTLDADAVSKVQAFLDQQVADVGPQLREMLADMDRILAASKETGYDREQFLPDITRPLMNIKAMSGMFHEMMVCRVSAFMLTFLEDVRKFDNDVVDIVGAYLKVAKTLLDLKIKEETNPHGQSFLQEIRNACKRYYDKQAAAVKG